MFERVGKDLDPGADRRHAASLLLITALLAGATAAIVTVAAWRTTEHVLGEVDDSEIALVEFGDQDPELGGAPPAPAPRAAPATTAAPAAEPDPEAVASLDPPPQPNVTSAAPAPGTADDDGGTGVDGGTGRGDGPGSGDGDGDGGGTGDGGDVRVLHHSEVVVKRRVSPTWPAGADALGVDSVDCRVSVRVDRSGAPTAIDVLDCPAAFHASVREALLRWRWFPAEVDGKAVAASFQLIVRYRQP